MPDDVVVDAAPPLREATIVRAAVTYELTEAGLVIVEGQTITATPENEQERLAAAAAAVAVVEEAPPAIPVVAPGVAIAVPQQPVDLEEHADPHAAGDHLTF